jgi:hypothetical protein
MTLPLGVISMVSAVLVSLALVGTCTLVDEGAKAILARPDWCSFERSNVEDSGQRAPDAASSHDGQGKAAKNGFVKLSTTQKKQMLAFLKSL